MTISLLVPPSALLESSEKYVSDLHSHLLSIISTKSKDDSLNINSDDWFITPSLLTKVYAKSADVGCTIVLTGRLATTEVVEELFSMYWFSFLGFKAKAFVSKNTKLDIYINLIEADNTLRFIYIDYNKFDISKTAQHSIDKTFINGGGLTYRLAEISTTSWGRVNQSISEAVLISELFTSNANETFEMSVLEYDRDLLIDKFLDFIYVSPLSDYAREISAEIYLNIVLYGLLDIEKCKQEFLTIW